MKARYLTSVLLFLLIGIGASAQCPDNNTITGTSITPPCPGSTSNNCVQGGQYVTVNVVAGNSYTFSTCTGTTFDTQITVYPTLGGASLGYNDDGCGLQSTVTWVATFTGQVDVLVDQYNCANNSTCGTLTISCSSPPPPLTNDDPCGAIALTVNSNCVFSTFTNAGAGATAGVPAPGCANYAGGDVWFSAVVPTSGVLDLETAAGTLTDGGMALYTAPSCSGPFSLVECDDDDGTGLMSLLEFTGLTPGSTVYIRVWEYGNDNNGTFDICASSPVPPAGDCVYTLNMADSWGDGWDGSQVCVTITPPGTTTCYTVTGADNTVLIGVNIGDLVTISYTAAGIFQNEISYSLTLNGGPLFSDGPNPSTGTVYTGVVDCIIPPAPPQDCVGGITICSDQTFNGNSSGTGAVVDLNTSNQGCLSSSEQQGNWYYFSPSASGTIGLTISPQNSGDDYDFAIWGPMSAVGCPPSGPPTRCSYAAPSGDTGMNSTATDNSEGAGGDKWVSDMNVITGEVYIMYIDNWSTSGQPFDLNWNLTNGASLDCTVLPLELAMFDVVNQEIANRLQWITASEHNTDMFELQRSADGMEFQAIGQVNAAGNSHTALEYSYWDEHPQNGVNYYRLKQTDLDGSTFYSQTVSTRNLLDGIVIDGPWPNENGDLQLGISAAQPGRLTFALFDLTGRSVLERHLEYGAGGQQHTIPLNSPAMGTYIFRLTSANGQVMEASRIQLGIK